MRRGSDEAPRPGGPGPRRGGVRAGLAVLGAAVAAGAVADPVPVQARAGVRLARRAGVPLVPAGRGGARPAGPPGPGIRGPAGLPGDVVRLAAGPGAVLQAGVRPARAPDRDHRPAPGRQVRVPGRVDAVPPRRVRLVHHPYGVGGIPSTFRPDIIAGCLSPEVAVRRAAALIGETSMLGEMVFWSDKAAVALAGLMHAAAVGGHDMAKVYLWANRAGESELAALARHPGASRELFAGLAEIFADTKAASSIRMTLLRSLGWLAVPELRDMVCGPGVRPVDAGEFAASRSTLYLILRDGSSSVAAPLFRLICDLMHHEGNLAATRTRYRRHVPGVFFAVDEVANIGLPKLAQKLADSAGFGSFMAIVIHSVAQLREAYSPDAAGAILACCGTKVIMPGLADADTLEDLSVLCGTVPIRRPGAERRGALSVLRGTAAWGRAPPGL